MREIFKLGTILMLYTLGAGALLALVYLKTAPVIEANRQAASGDSVRIQVLPGMDGGFEQNGEGEEFTYWNGYTDTGKRNPGGYVFIAQGKGYSSTIETMVGVDMDGVVTGAKILFQQETPGLGDKVEEIRAGEDDPWFPRQFIGKTVSDNFDFTKDGGDIDAITGATISSSAVTRSISNGLNYLAATLTGQEVVIEEEPEPVPEEAGEPIDETLIIPTGEQIAEVLPGMPGGYQAHGIDTIFPYWTGYRDTAQTSPGGYVFIAREPGFASLVQTLVATDENRTITSVNILSHHETPEYGDKIEEIREGETDPWFIRQFVGKSASDSIALVQDGGDIDAITEATVTSIAVVRSMIIGLADLGDALAGKIFPVREEPVAKVSEAEEIAETEPEPFIRIAPGDALADVLPGMPGGYEKQGTESAFQYWIGYGDSEKSMPGGYAFVASGRGFASTIETLVGVNGDGTIIGIKTLFHEETPDYGDKILEIHEGEDFPWFTDQYKGKSASDTVALKDNGGVIDAITGATITSNAVTMSVAEGLENLMTVLSGEEIVVEEPVAEGPATVLPDMPGGYELIGEGTDFPYWTGWRDNGKTDPGGYVFTARERGFASTIETFVGVDADGMIVGIRTLFHEETPGYGDKLEEIREGEDEPWFVGQFIGKSASDKIALVNDGGDIDALTGATVTSNAVTQSVSEGLAKLMGIVRGEIAAPETELALRLQANAERESWPEGLPTEKDLSWILPDMNGGYTLFEGESDCPYWIGYSNTGRNETGGYAFLARGKGFASTIETLVGVTADGAIFDIMVFSHEETIGYGDKIKEIREGEKVPWFTLQFIGKSAPEDIAFKADGGLIDAITGATVSSRAITESVANGLRKINGIISDSTD